MKTQYKNHLPHIAPVGATFFVTFRLADSLPQSILNALNSAFEAEITRLKKEFPDDYILRMGGARKRSFGNYEHQLDSKTYGACYLKEPAVAEILISKMQRYNGNLYDLHAVSIMPNHVHVLFSMATQIAEAEDTWSDKTPENYVQLDKVMQFIKGGSAFSINKYLKRSGKLWFKDSYDHYVRTEKEWLNIVHYILRNPVKAGLASNWEKWPFNYCKPELLEYILYRG